MFRFNSNQKPRRKYYELKANEDHVRIPLKFNGKSVELNSKALDKGQYILHTEERKERDHIWVMVL